MRPMVVGLADTFSTEDSTGLKRWEVDLLAVHPAYQGRGIGKILVDQAIRAGQGSGADIARALVRVDNIACQKTLRSLGFLITGEINTLQVFENEMQELPIRLPPGAVFVPVQTYNYRGFWLETTDKPAVAMSAAIDPISPDASQSDQEWTLQHQDVVGIIVPEKLPSDLAIDGYQVVGRYQWWTRKVFP